MKEIVDKRPPKFIKALEDTILPVIEEIGKFRSDSTDDDRGATLLSTNPSIYISYIYRIL